MYMYSALPFSSMTQGWCMAAMGTKDRSLRYTIWFARSSDPPLQEKALVYHIALAHTGTINGGSKDTIARVPVSMDLDGEKVQSRELAALVRFADELAEGPQRTSSLKGDPPFDREADSEVYHRYASISNIHIDREDGRIALTYHFDMCDDYMDPNTPRFRDLLEYTFERALKLDRERRYARFLQHPPRALHPHDGRAQLLGQYGFGSTLRPLGAIGEERASPGGDAFGRIRRHRI